MGPAHRWRTGVHNRGAVLCMLVGVPPRPCLRTTTAVRWRWVGALVALLVLQVVLACGGGERSEIVIATGQRGGTFMPLGETLARSFASDLSHVQFSAVESPGGLASIAMLADDEAQLALLSNHVAGADGVQLIAPLYEETLQIVVRIGPDGAPIAARPHDLAGRRVSVGPAGSGTESIADAVLQHFGVTPEAFDRRNLALVDATAALEAGELDAAFIVGGMRTPAVDRLLARDDMTLLSLGEPGRVGSALEGIRLDAPYFTITAIPENAYGRKPTAPIGTISVHALLVAREDLDEDLVQAMTESLFAHKVQLAKQERLLSHLSERYDPAMSPYPLHAGADRYYRRDEPTFLAKHIDEISFAITIGALLFSGFSALRAARRQARRNRVETHYEEARRIVAGLDGADDEQRRRAREQLAAVRERALGELAQEQLDANEGFVILQQYISAHLAEIDHGLASA